MLDYNKLHSSGERIFRAFPINKKVWNKTKKTAKRTFVLWTAFAPDWAIVLVWLIVGLIVYSLPVVIPFAIMDAPYSIASSIFAVLCLCVTGTHFFFNVGDAKADDYFLISIIGSTLFGVWYLGLSESISHGAFWRCLFAGFVAILTNCVLYIHVAKKYKRLAEEKTNREISLLTSKGWFTDLLYRKEDFEEKRITFLGRELTLRQAEYEFKRQDTLYQKGEPECNIEELANLGEELSEMLLEEEAIQKLDKYQDKLIKKYSAEIDNRSIIMPDWVADEDGSLYLPKPPKRFKLNSVCKLTQEEAVSLYLDAVSNYENGIPTGLTDSEFDALEYYVTGKSQVVELNNEPSISGENEHSYSGDYENYSDMQWEVLEKTYPEADSEVEWFNEEFQIPSLNPPHRGVKKSTNKDKIYRWLKYNSGAVMVPKYDGFWCRIWFKNGQIVSCRTKKETITDWVKSNIHFEDTDFTGCITGELVIFHEEAEIMRVPNNSRSQGKHPFWNLREYLASRMNGNNTIEYGELKIAIHRPRKELPANLPSCIYHESHSIPNCEALREYVEVDDFVGRKANYCQDGWVLYSYSGMDCLAYKIDSSHF